MTGDELRDHRTRLHLFQGNLAGQLHALGLELPGGQKIDQPAVSQMERGRIEIPAEVAAAVSGGRVQPGNDAPPPVGTGSGTGRKRRKVTAKPAAAEQPPTDPPVPGDPPPPAEPPPPSPAAEQPPRPADAPPALPAPRPQPRFDEAARSQLEADLRKLFAGDTFLVPVEVRLEGGETRIDHHEGQIPGIAQVVAMVDKYDGRVIEVHAAAMARAWADLAAENAAVRRFLVGLTYGGAWRGVIAATMPVVLAIAQHHGAGLPAFLGGAPTPTDAPAVA